MKPVTYTTVFSFVLLCLLGCRETPKKDDIFITANNLYSQQEYEQCIALISEHESQKIKITPEQQFYLSNLKMNSLFNLGYYNRCNEYLDTMLIKYPDKTGLYSKKGQCYQRMQLYDSAIQYYTLSINFKKGVPEYYNNRGFCFMEINKNERAINDLDSAIMLDSTFHLAYNGKGHAYIKLGEYQEAIKNFSYAIKLDSNYLYFNNRGVSYFYIDKPRNAKNDFDASLGLNPSYTLALTNKGHAYKMMNNLDSACYCWEMAMLKGNKEAEVYYKENCEHREIQ